MPRTNAAPGHQVWPPVQRQPRAQPMLAAGRGVGPGLPRAAPDPTCRLRSMLGARNLSSCTMPPHPLRPHRAHTASSSKTFRAQRVGAPELPDEQCTKSAAPRPPALPPTQREGSGKVWK